MPKQKAGSEEWCEYRHDDGETLGFRFVRSARKTLALYVNRDGSVLVRAPLRMAMSHVFLFMRERWLWLVAQRSHFLAQPVVVPFAYRSGEEFLHLGEYLLLRVEMAGRNQARLVDGELQVSITAERMADPHGISGIIELWQRREAKRVFPLRLAACYGFMPDLQRPFPALKIRKMRARWGSCAKDGLITLNLDLIKMPVECIDYVVTHELCHLVEFNHSARFYELQSRYIPDWKARRQRLDLLARQQYGL